MAQTLDAEIASQPAAWREAAGRVRDATPLLPASGARVAFAGCGTSWYVAQSAAALREDAGAGESDAFAASEMPARRYDAVVAITRSGTTTEVLRLLERLRGTPTVAITAVGDSPAAELAGAVIVLDFADEESIVQTRFATTAVALLRAWLGADGEKLADGAAAALEADLPRAVERFERFVFLGGGWTTGLAAEAALKVREAARAWSESYPPLEIRHGPLSAAGPQTIVWSLTFVPDDLAHDVEATGATLIRPHLDPLAELVLVHRAAVALARARGLDPASPVHLTRSVVLDG